MATKETKRETGRQIVGRMRCMWSRMNRQLLWFDSQQQLLLLLLQSFLFLWSRRMVPTNRRSLVTRGINDDIFRRSCTNSTTTTSTTSKITWKMTVAPRFSNPSSSSSFLWSRLLLWNGWQSQRLPLSSLFPRRTPPPPLLLLWLAWAALTSISSLVSSYDNKTLLLLILCTTNDKP